VATSPCDGLGPTSPPRPRATGAGRTSSSRPQQQWVSAQSDRRWVSHSWKAPMWCSEGTSTPPLA
jgi:hypothetical protein